MSNAVHNTEQWNRSTRKLFVMLLETELDIVDSNDGDSGCH